MKKKLFYKRVKNENSKYQCIAKNGGECTFLGDTLMRKWCWLPDELECKKGYIFNLENEKVIEMQNLLTDEQFNEICELFQHVWLNNDKDIYNNSGFWKEANKRGWIKERGVISKKEKERGVISKKEKEREKEKERDDAAQDLADAMGFELTKFNIF